MKSPLPEAALSALIELGDGLPNAPDPDLLDALRPHDSVNRQSWTIWDGIVDNLSEPQHAALARGLVIAEKELSWSGGSVASAIWVFRAFERRFPSYAEVLAEWMLQNSDNPWVPFTTNRGEIRTLAEFRAFQSRKAARHVAATSEARQREEIADARRATTARLNHLRQTISKAESDARKALLVELASLSLRERLLHLALDETHPVQYYPAEAASGDLQALDTAGQWALAEVKRKAAKVPRGPWSRWLKSLQQGKEAASESDAQP